MLISGWSSDVCSSDLEREAAAEFDADLVIGQRVDRGDDDAASRIVALDEQPRHFLDRRRRFDAARQLQRRRRGNVGKRLRAAHGDARRFLALEQIEFDRQHRTAAVGREGFERLAGNFVEAARLELTAAVRSEEPTSELQSIMRLSYAVFCLKKKKNRNTK